MNEDRLFMKMHRLEPGVVTVEGCIATDSSGDPDYADDGSVVDQDGEALLLPRGLESVTKRQAGIYQFKFRSPWTKLRGYKIGTKQPLAQGFKLGTVDLRTVTLADVNTKTLLITTSGSGGEQTVTFTTPSSIADIAVQINAVVANSAEIITADTGAKYLRLRDVVLGSASSIAVNSTSTGDTLLLGVNGFAAITGKDVGAATIVRENPRDADIVGTDYLAARTIDVAIADDAGGAHAMASSAIYFEFDFINSGPVEA